MRRSGKPGIDNVEENLVALNVAEKAVAQPSVSVGPRNNAGDVCHAHAPVVCKVHDSEMRVERGEGIRSNSRVRVGYCCQKCGFPGVWQPNQANICKRLELQRQPVVVVVAKGVCVG